MKLDDRVSNYMAVLNCGAVNPDVQRDEDEASRERLNVIRQQLAAGTYNISGKDVADKILNILKG